jgi:hypothetical protein
MSFLPPPEEPPPAGQPQPGLDPLVATGAVALGLGAAAGGVAIGLGVHTLSLRDAFDASGRRDRALHDEAVGFRTGTNLAWAGAGVLVATGVVLLVVSAASSGETDASLEPGSLTFRF